MANYANEINKFINKFINRVISYERKGFRIGLKGEKLSILDWQILLEIGKNEKKIYELIEQMGIDRSLITASIKNLTANNYIIKERCQKDKRAYVVVLTNDGREIFEEFSRNQREFLDNILSDITLNEEKVILKFLKKAYQQTARNEKK